MHCAQARNLIALMVGDDLDAAERPEVERHMAQCASCKEYHDGMTGVHRELHAATAHEEPTTGTDSLWTTIQPAVALESARRGARRFNGWIAGLAVAASVAAVMTISSDFVSPTGTGPGTASGPSMSVGNGPAIDWDEWQRQQRELKRRERARLELQRKAAPTLD